MADSAIQSLPVGTTVHARYQILSIVGRGGLGTVYQVSDVLFGKQNVYALKELIDQSPGARKQFEYESHWLQSLDHLHIPKFREHFEWGQRLYLVMDFVDGENLEQKLARQGGRPLREADVLRWILPICDALQYLHSRVPPILHRDVKPANIIVTPAGHPVLVDLGIAKEHLPGANQTATFVRKAGTEGYAPPEQYTAAGQTGPWSDVYGLGATLYHLLTGGLPPTAVDRVALDRRLLRPREINPAVSAHVDDAICRALALRPADRYQSIRDFARALMAATGSQPAPRPSAPRQSPVTPLSWPSAPGMGGTGQLPALGGNAPLSPLVGASRPSSPSDYHAAARPSNPARSGRTSELQRVRAKTTGTLPASQLSSPTLRTSARDSENGDDAESERAASRTGLARLMRSPVAIGTSITSVILITIVLAVLILHATAPLDRSSPRATITGYYAALMARDYNSAWQYSSSSRNNNISESDFISQLQADDAQNGYVKTASIANLTQNASDSATATVNVTRSHSPDTIMSYSLSLTQYNGDTWLIDSITSS